MVFRRLVDRVEIVGTVAAIAAFLVFLGVALHNLSRISEVGSGIPAMEAVLSLMKTQHDAQQLALLSEAGNAFASRQQWWSVDRAIAGLLSEQMPIIAPSFRQELSNWRDEMDVLMRAVAREAISINEVNQAISTRIARLNFIFRRSMDRIADQAAEIRHHRRLEYEVTVLGVLISCCGALLCGAFLIMRLLQSLHRAREAEAKLRDHLDALEGIIGVRTQDLARAEAQLRDAINTAPDGFVAFDRTGSLLISNQGAQGILSALPGVNLPAATLAQVLAAMGATLPHAPGDTSHSLELQTASDSWLMVTVRRSADDTAVMRFADVTPYKRAAKALETALYREQNLRRMYKDFVNMVSHQFRTPLAIIDSGAQKILRHGRSAPWEEVIARVGQIRSATDGLVKLVDGTLDSNRLETGDLAYGPVETDITALLSGLTAKLSDVYSTHTLRLDLDLPPSVVCDPLLIEHVMSNLISNSAKFSPPGTTIAVTGRRAADSILIGVADEGLGIPADELDHIFDPAYRAQNAENVSGSGIGLHVARRIARLHGGDISAVSEVGRGSVVTLKLPAPALRAIA